ncbi:MAG: CvpA family protein [Candidatus Promineofilum sp.]|nr:CvpA family protein [Promineifilum sp.]MBP9656903.1 CvpA family protein [Promineifilum sp.]
MLSLVVAFWIMVLLFAFVGMMRGWTKEVVATSSCILALFMINQFISTAFNFAGWKPEVIPPLEVRRYQFYIMSAILLTIAFFGYQGPTLASSRVGDRLSRRDNLQDRVLGFLVGGLNGWFVVGSIWSFLEYHAEGPSKWVRFAITEQYPFNPAHITRPAPELAAIIDNLPIPMLTQSPLILPLLLAVVFLFILVVLL